MHVVELSSILEGLIAALTDHRIGIVASKFGIILVGRHSVVSDNVVVKTSS